MRRTYLRGHNNILQRLLIHTAGFNLGLLLRTLFGVGTPRGLQGNANPLLGSLNWLVVALDEIVRSIAATMRSLIADAPASRPSWRAV